MRNPKVNQLLTNAGTGSTGSFSTKITRHGREKDEQTQVFGKHFVSTGLIIIFRNLLEVTMMPTVPYCQVI